MSVELEIRGATAVITLNRPEKRNAINPETTLGLDAALNHVDDDPAVRVAVLTGAGGIFSAGTDLKAFAGEPTERGGEYGVVRRERTTPLIAAVEGLAFGGGMEIVMACDLVVAGASASFGLPEVRRGLIPTCGGLFRTQRPLPLNIANEMLLTGEPISAERAHGFGFVNRLVVDGNAVTAALGLAETVILNSPVSLSETLAAGRRLTGWNAGWPETERATQATLSSPDAQEGIRAFLERRPPVWTGR